MSDDRYKTMTVGELRAALAAYSGEAEVWATWEGVIASIRTENFDVTTYPGAIVIDVEDYGGFPHSNY